MTINERISEILHYHKELTQKQLAQTIGIAASTVNNWLKLGRSIPAEYIIPISEFLGVDCEFLLTGKHITKKKPQISTDDIEWLSLIHQLPKETQYEFRGEIKGYLKRLNEESVTADEPLGKTGTDDLGK
ncbi:helix-turn-helix domain-containing protein [bacterium D16-51]|nr:helix-turn-helix domain-containing protein [bacterium D16-59]RKI54315.1 helix-turn-helix domain-containing protein [bacterium D16-51]